jgi:hypothetical protein
MKNIHVLPTDKPSRLIRHTNSFQIKLKDVDKQKRKYYRYNIYITSDEEYKVGDVVTDDTAVGYYDLDNDGCPIIKDSKHKNVYNFSLAPHCKKIILTTDQNLIKDGVQAINDEFLEWFVKNPSCEFVKVEQEMFKLVHNPNYVNHTSEGDGIYLTPKSENLQYGETLIEDNVIDYKIIIPKEEPKQETLSWDELVQEAENKEELIKILKLPHIAPLVREAMRNSKK